MSLIPLNMDISYQTFSLAELLPIFFLTHPENLSVDYSTSLSAPSLPVRPDLHLDCYDIIVITLIHIWSAHWLFVFQERRFRRNGVAAKAVLHIHQVQAEYQQKPSSPR